MRDWYGHLALVAAVAAVVMFTNLGGPRLWDRDEPRNAGCAQEMLARGDWVTPVFNAELRTHKPVLLYWLIMSAYSWWGVDEFSARFWSALLAVGTCLCTYALGRRLFNSRVGLWAGIALASSLMFGVAGRAATPDSTLIFFATLALTVYVYGAFPGSAVVAGSGPARYFPQRWTAVALMYAVMGIAILAKGPVGLVLPTAVVGMFLLIMRLPEDTHPRSRWLRALRVGRVFGPGHFLRTCWAMRPLTAVVVAGMVALPWYVWVGVRTDGEFLRGFFLDHNFGRAMQSMEGHRGSILFYPAAILVGFFPWSVFALPIFIDGWYRSRSDAAERPAYLFIACWIGVYVGLFSLARTKLPSYVTPCYPALALAAGCFLDRWLHGVVTGRVLWRRLAFCSYILVGLVLIVALPLVAHRYLPGEEWLGVVGLIPLSGGLVAWWLMERQRVRRAFVVFASTATLFITSLFAVVAARVDRHQEQQVILSEVERRGSRAEIAALGCLEPSWVFYSGKPIREISGSGNADWMGTYTEVQGSWHRRSAIGLANVAADPDGWLLITTDRQFERLGDRLAGRFRVLVETPYFLKKDRLVLLGPVEPAPAVAAETEGGGTQKR